ncbi:MAG: hypothetical protein V3U02_00145 [Calditrichia bacterium]
MVNHNTVKNLTIVSTQLEELSKDLDPPMSDKVMELQKKLWYILETVKAEELPIYKTPTKLLQSTNKQFILPIPAKVRDLLELTRDCRDVIVTVHECNGERRWICIKLVHHP